MLFPPAWEKAGAVNPRAVKDNQAAAPGPAGNRPPLAAPSVLVGESLGKDGSWEESRGLEGWFDAQTINPPQTFIPDHSELLKFGALQKQPNKNIIPGSRELLGAAAAGMFGFPVLCRALSPRLRPVLTPPSGSEPRHVQLKSTPNLSM